MKLKCKVLKQIDVDVSEMEILFPEAACDDHNAYVLNVEDEGKINKVALPESDGCRIPKSIQNMGNKLVIDLETGQIKNWIKPKQEDIETE